jgi:adenosylcobinamide-GDP ribazoletransferase
VTAAEPGAPGDPATAAPQAVAVTARDMLEWEAEARAAISLLTRLPVRAPGDGRTGSAAFAAVGAGLGAAAAVPVALVGRAAPLPGACLALAAMEAASGALHLDGLADSADALAAPDAARAEAARTDPRVGSAGAGAIVLVLGTAAAALAALPSTTGALVVAGATSRAVPALAAPLAARATARRGPGAASAASGGFGAWFAARSGPGGAAAAGLTCAAVAAGVAALSVARGPGGRRSALAPFAGGAAGIGAGLALLDLLARRFGTTVGDHYGAAIEVAFAASLVAQAAVEGGRR